MPYPTISGALATIATKFGGDVMNVFNMLFGGVDVAATDATLKPKINTRFRFLTQKLAFMDATTPTPREVEVSVANQSTDGRRINIPNLDDAVNDFVFTNEPARLFEKTLDGNDGNIFANIPASAFIGSVVNNFANVGVGLGIGKNIAANTINLKTLLAGSNVQLTSQTDTLTIAANPASLGGFLPITADFPSSSQVGLSYLSLAGGNASTTLTNRTIEVGMDIKVTAVRCRVPSNSANGNIVVGIVDDGTVVASVTITTGGTGYFENELSSPITILAGSQVAISVNNQGSSGTYEIRPISIEVVSGIPASGSSTAILQVPDWTIYMEAGTMKARKNSDGTTPYTSTTNIMSILNSILGATTNGAPTLIEIGSGVFPATTGMTQFAAADIGFYKIRGQGPGLTTIQLKTSITGNPTIFDFQGGVTGAQANLITANGVLHAFSITVSAGDWANFAVNDFVLLRSTKDWITGGQGKQGEIKQIFAKPSSGVIQFDSPLQDTYNLADTANIIKLNMLQDVAIEDLTIKPENTSYAQTGPYIDFRFCRGSRVKNVEVWNMPGSLTNCVQMRSCIDTHFIDVYGIMDQNMTLTGSHPYGIKITQACQNCSAELCGLRGPWRHFVASEGSTASNCEGPCRGITIENCYCYGVMDSGFDTHESGENIQFVGCTVMGGAEHGFNVRSPGVQVKNCQVFDCEYGIYLFQDADNAQIIGNYVKGCDYGIRFSTGMVGELIADNTCISCQAAGIYLTDDDTDINIVNNRIINCNLGANNAGIYDTSTATHGCLRVKVVNNRITGNHRAIRMLNDSTEWQIFDNNCDGNNNTSQLVGINRLRANTGDTRLQDMMIPTTRYLSPPRRAEGQIIGRRVSTPGYGTGLLSDITLDGTPTGDASTASWARGAAVWWGTTTTTGTVRGERTTDRLFFGQQCPSLFVRFSLGWTNVADIRFFVGFSSDTNALDNSNDPLNNFHGFGLQMRPNNTDFRICHNAGDASDSQDATGITPATDTLYSFFIKKRQGGNWYWELWASNNGDVTQAVSAEGNTLTDTPSDTTAMGYMMEVVNVNAEVFLNRIEARVTQEYF
jgi:copper-binding protein NosD